MKLGTELVRTIAEGTVDAEDQKMLADVETTFRAWNYAITPLQKACALANYKGIYLGCGHPLKKHVFNKSSAHECDHCKQIHSVFEEAGIDNPELEAWLKDEVYNTKTGKAKTFKGIWTAFFKHAPEEAPRLAMLQDSSYKIRAVTALVKELMETDGKPKRRLTAAAQASQHVKARLQARFPGKKFSAKSENFSGGSSLRVYAPASLTPHEMNEARQIVDEYQYGRFDGMTDSYEVTNSRSDIPQVSYAFCEQKVS
jgi:hypothetical protein